MAEMNLVADFRSDTVTQPTDEMRKAIAAAKVGDDVWGEDPTVNELERVAAERMGKEAAVFMPTGTMVNQVAVWVHTGRKGAMVCEAGCHILMYEGGGAALLSNVMTLPLEGKRGVFTPQQIEPWIPPANDPHFAPLTLVTIENTHNRAGGTVWTPTQTKAVCDFAHAHKIPVHLDGARIFNSAIAQAVPVTKLTGPADSVGFCLSKGLSAPVGSLLCGTKEFVEQSRHVRKTLGGGMRQAGFLAAAGLVALETMVHRLREDHENARRLAAGLAKLPGIRVDMDTVQTNMVMFDITGLGITPDEFCARTAKEGILAAPRDMGPVVRMVTHRNVDRKDVERALEVIGRIVPARPLKAGARRV